MNNCNVNIKSEYQENITDLRYKKMLEFIQTHPHLSDEEIIKYNSEPEFVEEFSNCRINILEWMHIKSKHRILEIHSGCGAVTQKLLEYTDELYCLETSGIKSQICSMRCKNSEKLNIYVGELSDWQYIFDKLTFDYIFVWGIFGNHIDIRDFLKQLSGMLSKNGKIVLAIDNKYGLKYWAGCKPDEFQAYFSNIEGNINAAALPEIKDILQEINCTKYEVYYPYPNYKFAFSIFSDDYMPSIGELSKNDYFFENERLRLFDENKVFDNLIRDGLFKQFSNSYLFIIEGAIDG